MASVAHMSNALSCSRSSLPGGAGGWDVRTGLFATSAISQVSLPDAFTPHPNERWPAGKWSAMCLVGKSAFLGMQVSRCSDYSIPSGKGETIRRQGKVSASLDNRFALQGSEQGRNGELVPFGDRRTEQAPALVRSNIAAGQAVIKVIGIGGGGCNAVNEMVSAKLPNVEFWSVNTDSQALRKALAPNRLQIGRESTHGRGAGGSCEVGEESATESLAELSMALEGADMVFIAAGMGGGTGSGAGTSLPLSSCHALTTANSSNL